MKINISYIIIFTIIFILTLSIFITLRSRGREEIINIVYKLTHRSFNDNFFKLASFTLLVTSALSFMGLLYSISSIVSSKEPVFSVARPNPGEGDTSLSLIVDSELYTGNIELPIKDKKYTFDEATALFSLYRNELDSCLLGNNESFLKVTTPLNFLSSIGEENISVSWHISNPDIIDYSGNPVSENISPDGSELEIIATLTLDDNVAEICYSIVVYPAEQTFDELLISQLTQLINSTANASQDKITLPTEVSGHAVTFYKDKSEFPSRYFPIYDNCYPNINFCT